MDLIKKFFSLQNLEYKKFQQRLIDTKYEIIGVRLPQLRLISKELAKTKENNTFNDKYFESIMVEGLIIHYSKTSIKEYFDNLDKFLNKIDNWAICDSLIQKKNEFKNELNYIWNKVIMYTKTNKEFTIRAGIMLIMTYLINDDYIIKIFEVCENIKNEKYYVKMGIAWLIAECYKKYPKITYNYLKNNKLNDWTHNKAIQKIKESLPINKEEKDKVTKLKR